MQTHSNNRNIPIYISTPRVSNEFLLITTITWHLPISTHTIQNYKLSESTLITFDNLYSMKTNMKTNIVSLRNNRHNKLHKTTSQTLNILYSHMYILICICIYTYVYTNHPKHIHEQTSSLDITSSSFYSNRILIPKHSSLN